MRAAASGPLVSIGCAVYNGQDTLERALDSLVNQTYRNIEIVIADDGSTDASLDIARRFAARDPRVRVHQNAQNLGVTENMNNVCRLATGEFFLWADQDDVRDLEFVSRTLSCLESDASAVLCHSLTGGFLGEPSNLKTIGSLGRVADESNLIRRYAVFLREFTDTTIYGLIRMDALRRTRLWPADVGSANVLLFELLLQGKFLEVPELLYFYSMRGLTNRPTPAQEYARANGGRRMPAWRQPFLVLAMNQTRSIARTNVGALGKPALVALVWGNLTLVNSAKALYRGVARLTKGKVPEWLFRLCLRSVGEVSNVKFLDGQRDESLFPRDWALRPVRN